MTGAKPAWGHILFLDLGRLTGWAEGDPADKYPTSGVLELGPKGSSSPTQNGALLLWLLRRFSAKPKIRLVCFESPISHLIPKQSVATKRMLLGYPAVVEAAAQVSHISDIREAEIAAIRRNLLGAHPGKGDEAKANVQERLRVLGCPFEDNNAADAAAGWYFACTIADARAGERVTPLFNERQGF
jgi:hypothetical protein